MSKGMILLVDDEDISRRVIAHTLQQTGFEVKACESAQQGLTELKESLNSISLIILDQIMPEMDGFAFLEELQKIDKNRQIPIIMLTAVQEGEAMVQAVEYGVLDYLTKPVNPQHLLEVIREVLA